MNRRGLLIALGIALLTGVVFALFPEFDVAIARLFHAPDLPHEARFALALNPTAMILRDTSMMVVAILVAPAVIALVLKLARPGARMLIRGRAVVFLISTLLLGPLLAANIILKDNWGRPRPRDLVQFGGTEQFLPWWDPRGTCRDNCSFVAGEMAGATWTLAPAALAPPQWRALAYAGALTFAGAVGLLRISFGGHFVTDVVFAGVIMFLIIWVTHGLLYRWRVPITDEAIETRLGRWGDALRRPFGRASLRQPQSSGADPVTRHPGADGQAAMTSAEEPHRQ